MLILLLLFSMLRSLQGAPTATSSFPACENLLSLAVREDPAPPACNNEQNLRTQLSIVQTCLLTIFACVWTAIHPNINGPRDSGWTRLKRKVTTTLVALIAPELILCWALEQRAAAREIADEYNAKFAKVEKNKSPGFFRPLSRNTTRRSSGQRWTVTHGFFVQMGGFLLYQNEYPIEVLDHKRLSELIRENLVDQPTVTERELQDRSKGDAISKGIVIWQTTWFAIQCCARLAQHLPLSELEVVTLAFTIVNVAIYVAWWNKPQSVDTAIRLQLKEVGVGNNSTEASPMSGKVTETENNSDVEHQSSQLSHSTDSVNSAESQKLVDESTSVRPSTADSDGVQPYFSDTQRLVPEDEPADKESWFRRKLRKDRHNHGLPIFLIFRLPYRIASSGLHYTLWKISKPDGFDGKRLRVPMFYTEVNSSKISGYSLAVIGLIFGAIHFIAWASEFPSHLDQVLWRCAAIGLVAFPSSFCLVAILPDEEDSHFKSKVVQWPLNVLYLVTVICFFLSILLYIPARLTVIILALKAICNPSPPILQDVSWTSFIPHL